MGFISFLLTYIFLIPTLAIIPFFPIHIKLVLKFLNVKHSTKQFEILTLTCLKKLL